MIMKKILMALAMMFALQATSMAAPKAPKDSVDEVVVYSDTTTSESAYDDEWNWDEDEDVDYNYSGSFSDFVGADEGLVEALGGVLVFFLVLILIFIVAPIALIGLILYFVYKSRKDKMRLMEMAVKNGKPLPPHIVSPIANRDDYLWNKGIKQMFLGVGLAILLYFILGKFGIAIGALIMLIGCGNLVIGYNARQKRQEQALHDQLFNQNNQNNNNPEGEDA
jgi:hypothetical protein